MDINFFRGLSTILVMASFIGVCWWAFSPKRKQKFSEAANLPFADDDQKQQRQQHCQDKTPRGQGPSSGRPEADKAENNSVRTNGVNDSRVHYE